MSPRSKEVRSWTGSPTTRSPTCTARNSLLLYGVVIVVTLVVCWVLLSGRSRPSAWREPFDDDAPREDWPVRVFGAVVIVGLGGYKLFVALSKGRYNVLFLTLMGVVALVILMSMAPGGRPREER